MKYFVSASLVFLTVSLFSQTSHISTGSVSPLASYSHVWNDIKYSRCNTAANAAYMSHTEKNVIYILNLIRANPALFVKTVLLKYPSASGNSYLAADAFYFKSLVNTLEKLEPLNILYPDKNSFESAKCHAVSSGISGYVGHKRGNRDCEKKKTYSGECCDYGHKDPLDIVLSLLIDEGIPSLGHRNVMLSGFTKVGVSVQPHKKYGTNAVFDFLY
jgi:uncharacterized protein YkwD